MLSHGVDNRQKEVNDHSDDEFLEYPSQYVWLLWKRKGKLNPFAKFYIFRLENACIESTAKML